MFNNLAYHGRHCVDDIDFSLNFLNLENLVAPLHPDTEKN